MKDFDEKVYQYTMEFTRDVGADVDPVALKNGILQHLASARSIVTDGTLERIGFQHVAVMINTAARYGLTLGEVMMEAVRNGAQPVSSLCSTLSSRKESTSRISKKPALRLVKN